MSTTIDKLQQWHLHGTALSNHGTCRCTTPEAEQPCQRTAQTNLDGLLHSLHEEDTCHCGETAMSNSVDELKARHNHCHLDGLLELVLHVHRDVTLERHKEARHLVHGPQGHELPPGLQAQGSKSVYAHHGQISTCPTTTAAPSQSRCERRGLPAQATRPAECQAACAILPSAPHGARSTVRHRS